MNKTISNRRPSSVARRPFQGLFPRDWFDDLFDQYLSSGNTSEVAEMMRASMDVAETEQAFEVTIDLPGVKQEDVEIHLDHNTLTVRGQRSEKTEQKDEKRQFHRVERFSGSFSRSIVLPDSVNEDEAAADFKDGVLKIVIPKSAESKPRRIKISS